MLVLVLKSQTEKTKDVSFVLCTVQTFDAFKTATKEIKKKKNCVI